MKELKIEELPNWAKKRVLPYHKYFEREDGALLVRCPQESNDLNMWVWTCHCERAN